MIKLIVVIKSYPSHQIRKGVKLVRGAYIEGERKLALHNGVDSPVCRSKDETDQKFVVFPLNWFKILHFSYDRIVSMLIKEASNSKLECVLAGHNENSIIAAVDQLSSQTGDSADDFQILNKLFRIVWTSTICSGINIYSFLRNQLLPYLWYIIISCMEWAITYRWR